MRIPAFVFEHPVESLVAGLLLLALLFAPTDRPVPEGVRAAQIAVAENL